MITFKNLAKSFDGKEVLKGVDGIFKTGKTNLIIGSSGTGKSVLLKCIVGIVKPNKGTAITYDGRNFLSNDADEIKEIRREIGMLFQGSALFDSKTVAENVRFPLQMMTEMSSSEKDDRVQFCLERVGLEQAADLMPSEISGGMKNEWVLPEPL